LDWPASFTGQLHTSLAKTLACTYQPQWTLQHALASMCRVFVDEKWCC